MLADSVHDTEADAPTRQRPTGLQREDSVG